MKTFGPAIFRDDTELSEAFTSMGPTKAEGNLKGTSIKTNGPLIVAKNLDIDETLKVNGPVVIHGSLASHTESTIKINGPATVEKGILRGRLKINGPLKAEYLDVTELIVNGPVTVSGDIVASDNIRFGIGFTLSEKYFRIGGVIEAPRIHFKNHGKLGDRLPGFKTFKRIFGVQSKFSGIITVENLQIKTKHLILEGVKIINSEIQAEKIEEIETGSIESP
ncbi:MAG: hypothetical protein ACXAC8_17350 [Candidatus Hodarchaeales archaeon]|jgi:cytoskeletal protein CcmA (bactofilin family)